MRHGLSIGSGNTLVEMSDDGLLPYVVQKIDGVGKPETTTGDRERPREDGEYFGRDRLRGRRLTIEGYVNGYDMRSSRPLWRRLMDCWDPPDVRGIPGQCVPLQLTYAGSTATVFGRPTNLDPRDDAADVIESGYYPWAATFRCVDNLFYGVEQSIRVPIVAAAGSGMKWPVKWPLRWSPRSASERQAGQFDVVGAAGSWLQATIVAPGGITRPVIEVEGVLRVELDMTIPADTTPRFVTVIASPWARSVLLDGVRDVAYALTPASGLLKHARVPSGPRQAILRGTDPTGTAYMLLSWRDAEKSI